MLPQAGRVAYRQEMSRGDVDSIVKHSFFSGIGTNTKGENKILQHFNINNRFQIIIIVKCLVQRCDTNNLECHQKVNYETLEDLSYLNFNKHNRSVCSFFLSQLGMQ